MTALELHGAQIAESGMGFARVHTPRQAEPIDKDNLGLHLVYIYLLLKAFHSCFLSMIHTSQTLLQRSSWHPL